MSHSPVDFNLATIADFSIQQELSRNASGAVFKAVCKLDGNTYALKRKNVAEAVSHSAIQTEVRLLEQLKHHNVVTCYGSFWDEDTRALYIVLEFCGGGDLRGLINRHKGIGIHLDEAFIWRTFDQICAGLTHLHEHGIVHRDIKSMNILLTDNGQTAKITDLGVSRQVSENTFLLKTLYGTPLYLSPEIVSGQEYNEKTDIWSLGIILYELCALVTPFHGKSLLALAQAINEGKLDPIPSVYSQDMRDFIVWVLTMDFNSRPSVVEVTRRRAAMARQQAPPVAPVAAPRRPLRQRQAPAPTPSPVPVPEPVVLAAPPEEDAESVADTESGGEGDCHSDDSLEVPRRAPPRDPHRDPPRDRPGRDLIRPNGAPLSEPKQVVAVSRPPLRRTDVTAAAASADGVHQKNLFIDAELTKPKPDPKLERPLASAKAVATAACSGPGEALVTVHRDRLQACIRRHALLLRRLLKMRAFAGSSAGHTHADTDAEMKRLSDLLSALDRAAATGVLGQQLAQSLDLCARDEPPREAPRGASGPIVAAAEDEQQSQFQYRPGRGAPDQAAAATRPKEGQGVAVQVLDYLQAPRPKKDAFVSNLSSHQLFGGMPSAQLPVDRMPSAAELRTTDPTRRRPHSAHGRAPSQQVSPPRQVLQDHGAVSVPAASTPSSDHINPPSEEKPNKKKVVPIGVNNIFDDRPMGPSARLQRRPHSAILSARARQEPRPEQPPPGRAADRPDRSPLQRPVAVSSSEPPSRPSSATEPQEIYRAQRRQRDGGSNHRGLLFDDGGPRAAPRNVSPILGGNERGDSREGRRQVVAERARERAHVQYHQQQQQQHHEQQQKPSFASDAHRAQHEKPLAADAGARRRNVITG